MEKSIDSAQHLMMILVYVGCSVDFAVSEFLRSMKTSTARAPCQAQMFIHPGGTHRFHDFMTVKYGTPNDQQPKSQKLRVSWMNALQAWLPLPAKTPVAGFLDMLRKNMRICDSIYMYVYCFYSLSFSSIINYVVLLTLSLLLYVNKFGEKKLPSSHWPCEFAR